MQAVKGCKLKVEWLSSTLGKKWGMRSQIWLIYYCFMLQCWGWRYLTYGRFKGDFFFFTQIFIPASTATQEAPFKASLLHIHWTENDPVARTVDLPAFHFHVSFNHVQKPHFVYDVWGPLALHGILTGIFPYAEGVPKIEPMEDCHVFQSELGMSKKKAASQVCWCKSKLKLGTYLDLKVHIKGFFHAQFTALIHWSW